MTSFAAQMRRLRALSVRELLALRDRIEHDPACRSGPGCFEVFTRPARRKLHAIAQVIEEKCAAEKAAKGKAA